MSTSVAKPEPLLWLSPDDLDFDAENPRLAESSLGAKPTQDELFRFLWQEMAVDEIAMSIAAHGYFEHEPLFVIKNDARYIVIEGNRRLAAVKLLLDPHKRRELKATDLPEISEGVRENLKRLPALATTRGSEWAMLGFKHLNGPAKWGSYAKARYIAHVHNDLKVPLPDIAVQIGDRNLIVQRLYQALMVLEQAEKARVYNKDNRYYPHLSFSHLYTGLGYEGIRNFIKLKDESAESDSPVDHRRIAELGELCVWLFGDKKNSVEPLVKSQNPDLRNLNETLCSGRGVDALRAGMPLRVAQEISLGDERVFRSALQLAKENLQKARGRMSTGFDGERELLRTAEEVADLADDLLNEMERKAHPRKRRTRANGDEEPA